MRSIEKRLMLIVFSALIYFANPFSVYSAIQMPAFFADGMVLQQQSEVKLWGTASPGEKVVVRPEWDKKKYSAQATEEGRWELWVQTPAAGGPFQIKLSDGEEMILRDVWIGEVWFCSGQSNMEMPMKGFKNQPVDGSGMDILNSTNNRIRVFTTKRTASFEKKEDVTGEWMAASPATTKDFSATAYYFGRQLNRSLQVPVGLVVASWGGSACEAWMNADMLRSFKSVVLPRSEADIKSKNRTPTVLFNGMLNPFIGMAMKGVIWYQGEDNYNRAHFYSDLFTTMVKGWRDLWGLGDFPFYYCQIAPYDYSIITEPGKEVINSAYLREQQMKAESVLPNMGMAVLMDKGMKTCIHPANKRVVGERLALLALNKTYDMAGVVGESPVYKSMEIKGDTVVVSFDRSPMWITGKGCFTSGLFQIAGEDKVFYPAKAWIQRSKVLVKSEQVKKPVAVRYAFENFADGDLFGTDGQLPVSSFRTDDW